METDVGPEFFRRVKLTVRGSPAGSVRGGTASERGRRARTGRSTRAPNLHAFPARQDLVKMDDAVAIEREQVGDWGGRSLLFR